MISVSETDRMTDEAGRIFWEFAAFRADASLSKWLNWLFTRRMNEIQLTLISDLSEDSSFVLFPRRKNKLDVWSVL